MSGKSRYWLVKTEPTSYSIDDLARDHKTYWDGVRNYQARNTMRDDMSVGDKVLFYHSNANPPGIAGLAVVTGPPIADHTAFDPEHKHFDPKSRHDRPTWMMIELGFVQKFDRFISLDELREVSGLDDMVLLQKGSRLSVQPVTEAQFHRILEIASTIMSESLTYQTVPFNSSAKPALIS